MTVRNVIFAIRMLVFCDFLRVCGSTRFAALTSIKAGRNGSGKDSNRIFAGKADKTTIERGHHLRGMQKFDTIR
ncbi:MAG: hypothetical protein ABJN26_10480 [Stappiaceae bacterium]